MTSAVVPILGMRRLRKTGTRTVGAGTTVEPAVGGRGVKAVAGEAASVAIAGGTSGRGANGRGACCSRDRCPGRGSGGGLAARRTRRWRRQLDLLRLVGNGWRRRLLVDRARPGLLDGIDRSCGGDGSRAGRCVRPVASRPIAVGARRGERRVVLGHRREHRQPGRRREGPGRRVGRHDREAPVVDDRLARQQPEVHPGGADPGSVRDHERDLRRLGASDPRGGGGDLVVDVEIDGARCHSGG